MPAVTRNTVRLALGGMGAAVLVSYAVGIARTSHNAMDLWGGLALNNRYLFVLPFMALAVFGFCLYWWTALVTVNEDAMNKLR